MPNITESPQSFYKMTGAEAKYLYKVGVFTAQAYVLMIVKSHGAAGWKWTFKIKDFCKEWEIPHRTFHWAVSKLKILNLLHWEATDRITVWYGTDIATSCVSTNTQQDVAVLEQDIAPSRQDIALPVQDVTQETNETLSEQGLCSTPDSSHIYLESTDNAADLNQLEGKASQELEPTGILEEPQTDSIAQIQQEIVQLLDKREIFDSLRLLGIETNDTVRTTLKKYKANVPSALAHIKQRYDNREKFRNITGAFVKACKEGSKPIDAPASWGLHAEVNPPSSEQMAALDEARSRGTIRDYFLSSDNICKVVLPNGFIQMPWWEWLATSNQR